MTIADELSKRIKSSGMTKYQISKALRDNGNCSMSTAYRMLNKETAMTVELAQSIAEIIGFKLAIVNR
mgnify:CR=1 FL=1